MTVFLSLSKEPGIKVGSVKEEVMGFSTLT